MSPLELRHLQALIAVYEERSFSRAAERLGIAQPLLSLLIKRVEEVVGHRLFDRRPLVQPTEAGRVFLDYATRAVKEIETGAAAAAKVALGHSGTLAVGYPSWIVPTFVPAAINDFRSRYPEVELQLRVLHTSEQIAAVRASNLHVGFLRDVDPGADIAFTPLYSEPWIAVVSESHPKAARATISLKDFDAEPYVTPGPQGSWLRDRLLMHLRGAGAEPIIVQETPSWFASLSMVEAGIGMAIVPRSQQHLWSRGVRYLPIRDLEDRTTVFACWLAAAENPLSRAFVDGLKTHAMAAETPRARRA